MKLSQEGITEVDAFTESIISGENSLYTTFEKTNGTFRDLQLFLYDKSTEFKEGWRTEDD